MFRQYIEETFTRSSKNVLRASLFFLVLGIGLSSHPSANAAPQHAITGNGHNGNGNSKNGHTGNGKHNNTDIAVNSPTINRGVQHTTNGNAGGKYLTQTAFCKAKSRRCKIVQRINVGR